MNILFVCTAGQQRSPTAAAMYADTHNTRYAGAFSVANPLRCADVAWADVVVCMRERHRRKLVEDCPQEAMGCTIAVLDIPDVYRRGDEQLKQKIRDGMEEVLEYSSE